MKTTGVQLDSIHAGLPVVLQFISEVFMVLLLTYLRNHSVLQLECDRYFHVDHCV